MNVLKNCSDLFLNYRWFECINKYFFIPSFLICCINVNAAEPITSSGAIDSTDYFKVVLGLAFVIALFLVSTFLYKRYGSGPMTGRGQLRLIDILHLGNRERLVLVELKDKQILLSITPGQISKLDTINVTSSVETTNA